jgi:MFS family permease
LRLRGSRPPSRPGLRLRRPWPLDRWPTASAAITLALGLLLSTAAFALYPLVRDGWHAVALAVLGGGGVGTWLTGQSALLAALVSPEQRPLAFAQQRVFANVGLGLGGAVGGLLVTTSDPSTFTTLFVLNAATFVAFGVFVSRVPERRRHRNAVKAGSYRLALGDRPFVGLLAVNYVYVAAAIALLVGLFPVYAKQEAGLSEDAIGLLFLLNSLLIIGAQVRVASAQGGKRRMRALARMGLLFACSWALVLAGGLFGGGLAALGLLTAAIAVFSFGECLYDTVQGPLTADLAPEGATGRYMALNGFSWQLGFITGPAIGAVILGAAPHALWVVAAVACCLAAVASLRLERRLPDRVRRTPQARPVASALLRRRRAATSSR